MASVGSILFAGDDRRLRPAALLARCGLGIGGGKVWHPAMDPVGRSDAAAVGHVGSDLDPRAQRRRLGRRRDRIRLVATAKAMDRIGVSGSRAAATLDKSLFASGRALDRGRSVMGGDAGSDRNDGRRPVWRSHARGRVLPALRRTAESTCDRKNAAPIGAAGDRPGVAASQNRSTARTIVTRFIGPRFD